jgi:hypothetical protein
MSEDRLIRAMENSVVDKDALIRELVAALKTSVTPTPGEIRAIDAALSKAKAAGYEP